MKRVLIVGPSWVGDTVLAQPLFTRLHEHNPGLVLDVLAPPFTAGVLARMPEVNAVIENPFRHGELKVFARRRLGITLRSNNYEQAIVLPNSLKSALPPFFASIARRTGYRGELRGGLLNDVRKLDEKRLPLMVERFAGLADPQGAPLARPLPKPRLKPNVANRATLRERLSLTSSKPVVALCPGAEYGPAKRWPGEHFRAIAERAIERGAQVWLLGSAADKAIADSIAAPLASEVAHNLCGRTTLGDAVDLISAASVVVTNDSGLMHIAAALDRPLIALFGSSSPGFTPPLSDQAVVMSLGLSCSPCFERECPLEHFRCLKDLSPERVFREIDARALLPRT